VFACHPFVSPFFVSPFFLGFPFGVSSTVVAVPIATPNTFTVAASQAPPSESRFLPDERSEEPATVEQLAPHQLTLLVFKDNSVYAVTDYWLDAGRLHYTTSYGGENSVPLEQVDLQTTVQMNWERGMQFVLRPKPSSR
jgi:hypothetical protein